MKGKTVKIFSSIAALLMVISICAGCNTKEGGTTAPGTTASQAGTDQAASATPDDKPVKISIMVPVWGESIKPDNPVLLALDKYINAELDIISVPINAYVDKVNVAIASQQIPDAMVIIDPKQTAFANAARGGVFWEVGPYLKDYSSFKDINPLVLRNSSIDGKNYGIPRERDLVRRGISYRVDWLRKAGLNPPRTLEDLYNTAKVFAAGDFDGNGKKDTIGMAIVGSPFIDGFDQAVVANGGPNHWGEKDGKLIPAFMTPEYLGAMNWLKKMYDEKLINQDFAMVKDAYTDYLEKERTGIIFDFVGTYNGDPLYTSKMQKDPSIKNGDIIDQQFLETSDATPRIPSETGMLGVLALSKLSIKSEAELSRIMTALNKLDDEVPQNLMIWGIEGVHFEMKNGKESALDSAKIKNEVIPVSQLELGGRGERSKIHVNFDDDPMMQRVSAEQKDFVKYVVPDLSLPLTSDTYTAKASEFDKLVNDATIKYVMGVINEDGWNKVIEQWKASGGDKVIEEFSAAYAKSKS